MLIGAGISGAVFVGSAALFFERAKFVFDPGTRTVDWSRRRLASEKSDQLSFDQVVGVVLHRSPGETNGNLRVALETTAGELPLSLARAGNDQQREAVARAIRAALGMNGDLVVDSMRAAVAAGRAVNAMAIDPTMRGLGLTEAKKLVDEIADDPRRPKA